jgi:hypothetical protein
MMNKKLVRPTDAEDAQITAAALTDPDNPPLTDEELQQSKVLTGDVMDSYVLLLDQIAPYLNSQFCKIPQEMQERISQAGMGEKTEKTLDGVEEFEWAHIEAENKYLYDEEAKEIEEGEGIRKDTGIRTKTKTEHYYIWNKLPPLEREYKVARYDFEKCPNHREKAVSEKLIETITPYLEMDFSDLSYPMKMNIAYVDNHKLWNEISKEQRKQMALNFDAMMQPDYEKTVNQYCDWELERLSIPDQILFWQRLNPNRIASEQIIIDTKIKELKEREVELEALLGYPDSNKEQEPRQVRIAHSPDRGTTGGIDKQKVMAAFHGIKWDSYHWSKNLGNPPQWLIKCRTEKGVRGNNKILSKWDPVGIAVALLDKGIPEEELDRVFKKPMLKDWADEWKEKTYS